MTTLNLKDLLSQKFNADRIKRIYLVPSKNIALDKIAKIHASFKHDAESIVIRFNQTDLTNSLVFNNATDIRIIRGHTIGFHLKLGYKLLGDTSADAIYIANNEKTMDLSRIKRANGLNHLYSFKQLGVVNEYCVIKKELNVRSHRMGFGAGASIGFVAIYNLLPVFPNATFYLLDFTFEGSCMHDWELEKRVCEENFKGRVVIV